jgi:hypothetical protein
MEPPSTILPILPLPFSTNIPGQPNSTFSILSVLPLRHTKSLTALASSTNNIPPPAPQIIYPAPIPQITYPKQNSNPQVKIEKNPPPPPLPQIQEPQLQNEAFPTRRTILTIRGGSSIEFESKWQCRNYYREVNHVVVEGPITQTKWSHISITFSAKDVNLTFFPHTDAMVVTIHIDQWDVSKILIDNGSQVEILFMLTFKKMGYDKK